MDGASSAAAASVSLGPELWRAIPTCFEYESIAVISRQPFSLAPITRAFATACKDLATDRRNVRADFKRAMLMLAAGKKEGYGHDSMLHRHDGIPYPLFQDITIGGFLPRIAQKRKNENGRLAYSNVADESDMWRQFLHREPNEKELRFWRRVVNGALSDDHDIIPRTAFDFRLTKAAFQEFPDEVRRQTSGHDYHSIGKKEQNCLTKHFNILRALDIEIPPQIAKHRIPQELNRDLREGKLDGVLAEYSSTIIAIKREPMAEAIRRFKGTPESYNDFVLAA